ncbi:MAG: pilin [Patescibacteria group bacterium]|nr:pilin [Patescibacteria group bacterium]
MMTKFNKNLIVIIFLILASFVVANFVFAQVDLGMNTEYGEQMGLSDQDPRITVARVIQVALGFLGIIAVVLIIYAGFLWMTSEGSEDKIEKAKSILKNAIIGLVIILSSFGIASFILNRLVEVNNGGGGGGNGGPGGGTGGGIGVLGSCTVESVYPEANQKEVPRNTSFIISFREEIDVSTLRDASGNILTDGRIKIYKTSEEETNFIKEVKVATTDNKTFIFTPAAYLGSPSESVWYTVYLSNDIKKTDGENIFKTCSRDYLEWQFQVSEKLDLTPPQVKAVNDGGISPKPGSTKPKNSIIQINFNEAINPITVSGSAGDVKDYIRIVNAAVSANGGQPCVKDTDCASFNCSALQCEGDFLQGKFIVSNQYQTIEFLSDKQCGVNGCGEKIYCLPGSSQIRVELQAAVLTDCGSDNCASRSPYNSCSGGHCRDAATKNYPLSLLPLAGVVDMALNSLDGNRDADADGPVTFYNENTPIAGSGDNYQWSFLVSEVIDLNPPKITATSQKNASGVEQPLNQGATGANLASPILIDFDKAMMSSSLKTGSLIINNGKDKVEHKLINLISATSSPGYWVAKDNIDSNGDGETDRTRVEVRHSMFGDSTNYRVQVGSGVKDINQNCFKPSSGPGCAGNPSCCAGAPTAGSECPQ